MSSGRIVFAAVVVFVVVIFFIPSVSDVVVVVTFAIAVTELHANVVVTD